MCMYLLVCIYISHTGATAANTNSDYLVAPAILNTFEANDALSEVFGVTGKGGGLEDDVQNIKDPERLRLRRVFNKSSHGALEEELAPGMCYMCVSMLLLFIGLSHPHSHKKIYTQVMLDMKTRKSIQHFIKFVQTLSWKIWFLSTVKIWEKLRS